PPTSLTPSTSSSAEPIPQPSITPQTTPSLIEPPISPAPIIPSESPSNQGKPSSSSTKVEISK
ncbi:MAG: hypothetical protein ACKPCM_08275, partial [Pseudanabaena sp.]